MSSESSSPEKSKSVSIHVKEAKPLTAAQEKEIDTYLQSLGCQLQDSQLTQFKTLCREFGLNPFKREIYGIPYNDKFNIIVGYEVYIKRANRTGLLDGMERGTTGSGNELKAWIKIYRKDWSRPFYHEVDYSEYVQMKWDYDTKTYKVNSMWRSKPKTMLLKVATAQAFRLCFPEDFAGMPYTSDELPIDGSESGLKEVIVDSTVKLPDGETVNTETGEIIEDKTPIQQAPEQQPPPQNSQTSSGNAKKNDFWAMLEQMHGANAADVLEKMTSFKGRDGSMVKGKRSMERVSMKQVGFLFKKVEKEYAEWKKLGGGQPSQGNPGPDAPDNFTDDVQLSDGAPQGTPEDYPPHPSAGQDEPPPHSEEDLPY